MRVPIPLDAVIEPGYATVTVGDMVVRCETRGDDLILYPERSYQHRLLAKAMGFADE